MGTARAAILALGLLFAGVAAPSAGAAVTLNEVNCEGVDWIELANPADEQVDVSGWVLTDDPLDGTRPDHRYGFPSGTTIPSGDELVVEKGSAGFPFGVSCGNDTIRLADSAGTPLDEVAVPTLTAATETWGRYPNATGPWAQTTATKAAANLPSSATPEPPGGHAAWMFEPTKVVRIGLSIPQASRDALDSVPDEYQPASFSLSSTGGTYGPLAVGVRLKGHSTFRTLAGKASFKIKFGHSVPGQRFFGLKVLTLNSMIIDPSMVHETLAYEMFRAAGVPASRTGYAYVQVDGQDYGLYLNLETLDDVSLSRWFQTTQHLYEGEHGNDLVPDGAGAFEVDEGDESDRTDLEALISAVGGSGDLSQRLASVADLDELIRMWAVERYIGHWDSYSSYESQFQPSNYFLHSDAAGRFSMLPWSTDTAWIQGRPFDYAGGGVMFSRCLGDPDCARRYREVVKALPSLVDGLRLDSRAAEIADLIAPWQRMDPRRETSDEMAAHFLRVTREFIARRPRDVESWLNPPSPATGPARPSALPPLASDTAVAPLALSTSLRRRQSLPRALRRGLALRVRCSRPCRLRVRALLPRRVARRIGLGSGRRPVVVARGSWPSLSGRTRTLTVHLSRRARRALRHVQSTSMDLEVRARDRYGLAGRSTRSVTLVR